jgi:hypothetical protein
METEDTDRFRRQAAVCREESVKCRSLIDAAAWLRLAEDFEGLVEKAQEPKRGRPPTLWIDNPPSR